MIRSANKSVCGAAELAAARRIESIADVEAQLAAIEARVRPEVAQAINRARAALYQQSPGRPPRFQQRDRRDLAEAERLIAEGVAKTFHAACILVAQKYPGDERAVRSIAERLRRSRARKIPST